MSQRLFLLHTYGAMIAARVASEMMHGDPNVDVPYKAEDFVEDANGDWVRFNDRFYKYGEFPNVDREGVRVRLTATPEERMGRYAGDVARATVRNIQLGERERLSRRRKLRNEKIQKRRDEAERVRLEMLRDSNPELFRAVAEGKVADKAAEATQTPDEDKG